MCVRSLLGGPWADLWPFYGLCSKRFSLHIKLYNREKTVYVSVKSKLPHAPPPGIPRAFDTFAVPGRREFDYQSLPAGGEFGQHPRFHVKSLAWRAIIGDAVLEDFRGKRLSLCGQLVTRKGLKQALCRI